MANGNSNIPSLVREMNTRTTVDQHTTASDEGDAEPVFSNPHIVKKPGGPTKLLSSPHKIHNESMEKQL